MNINEKEAISNTVELSVLNFFQKRIGFKNWWDSLDESIQGAMEKSLIDCTYDCLEKKS